MKVKVFQFWGADEQTMQDKLSTWLTNNPEIDVRFINQSESQDSETYCFTISVWYE